MEFFKDQTIPTHKTTIMVHCLATSFSWGKNKPIQNIVKEVTNWHVKDRGWKGIAYAAIIGYDGEAGLGRDLDKDGDVLDEIAAAAKGWNKKAIHLALVGGRGSTATDSFFEHYTHPQEKTLLLMIKEINRKAGRELEVVGHNQYADKACPGFYVPLWYDRLKSKYSPPKKQKIKKQSAFEMFLRRIFNA